MAIDERTTQGKSPAAVALGPSSAADDIGRILAQEGASPAFGAHLAGRLAELEGELMRRYESEACTALYEDVPKRNPRYDRRLNTLRREHRALVGRVRRLAATAHEAEDETLLTGVRAETQALLADLRRHEEAEQRLLSEAMFVDIGVAD